MKKLIALVLAAVMMMTVVAAFAAVGDLTPDATITINGLDEGDTVHLYKVLEWTDGVGWTAAEGFAALVKKATDDGYDANKASENVAKIVANTPGVSLEKEDLEKIATLAKAGATDLGTSGTLSGGTYTYATNAADKAGMYIALVTPGKAGVIYNPIVVSADFSKTPDTSAINASSAKMGSSATAKKETITVSKESEELDQAQNETTNGSSDTTNNSHDVGDIVKFTVTTKIPAYSDSYVNPSFKVTDTLSKGLKMVVDSTNYPFTVTTNPTVAGKDTNVAPQTDDVSWVYEFDSDGIAALTDYAEVTITYYAKIDGDVQYNVNEKENTVEIEFSNNPNDDGSKGKLKDKTKHYTFTIDGNLLGGRDYKNSELVKVGVDKNGNPIESVIKEDNGSEFGALAGALFGLYTTYDGAENETEDKLYKNSVFNGTVTTDAKGLMTISGLDEGTYYLKELNAPDGYIRDQQVYTITIDADIVNEKVTEMDGEYEVSYEVPVLKSYTVTVNPGNTSSFSTTITGSQVLESTSKGDVSSSVKNTKGVELPSTGGIGTTLFYLIGGVLVLGAGMLIVTRRRVSAE